MRRVELVGWFLATLGFNAFCITSLLSCYAMPKRSHFSGVTQSRAEYAHPFLSHYTGRRRCVCVCVCGNGFYETRGSHGRVYISVLANRPISPHSS